MKKLTKRKTLLLILFLSILVSQFLIYKAWFNHNKSQENVTETIDEIIKPNQSLFYSNEATKNFINAGINFNEYLQNRDQKYLKKYQSSINIMTVYLDSLIVLSKTDKNFANIINNKTETEKQVSTLQKQLDSLMNKKINTKQFSIEPNFKIRKYDYEKILSTITYDTVKKISETKKKGLLGRIGSAIAGKSNIDKQEIQSTIKMTFNNQEKSGSFEDQLRNTFKETEIYYNNNFSKLKKTYFTLKNINNDLLQINKLILEKSQKVLIFYSQSAQEATLYNYTNSIKKYNSEISAQKNMISSLLFLMGIATVLLLLYTFFAFKRETDLEKAKNSVQENLNKKNQLIGMLSHEMRAPLNVISNYSTKLKKHNTDQYLAPTIESVHFASNSLQITVSQILDFIKNENNKLQLYKSNINLKNEITAIIESLKSLSDVKNIEIITNFDQSINIDVLTDKVKIQQLFYNIIVNAIKFTNEGTITVNTKITSIDNKLRLDASIVDTGVGIPEEEVKKVFEEFYQSKSHKEIHSIGAGLGLNLCKNIVELLNGTIGAKSELNKGTEIYFSLIVENTDSEHLSSQKLLEQKSKNQNIKIVIVDDDQIILEILKKLVTKIGFEVIVFDKAPETIKYLNNTIVDLIITDIQIFDYSGLTLLKEIKKINNDNNQKPIIAITGDSYLYAANENTSEFDEIMIKPIDKEEFYEKVLKVLENSNPNKPLQSNILNQINK